jgi:putative transposase
MNETKYLVKSQNDNGDYDVLLTDLGWVCSCPDHKFRGVKYKHIFAVGISFALHKEVARIERDIDFCVYCNSVWIVKDGLRHTKYGNVQKFNCNDCGRYFTINQGFERMQSTSVMQCFRDLRRILLSPLRNTKMQFNGYLIETI